MQINGEFEMLLASMTKRWFFFSRIQRGGFKSIKLLLEPLATPKTDECGPAEDKPPHIINKGGEGEGMSDHGGWVWFPL